MEPHEAADEHVIHLDEIAGGLYYEGSPVVSIADLKPKSGYGNRHVSRLPYNQTEDFRTLLCSTQRRKLKGDRVFECLECRRWSVGLGSVFCSRKCRLARRAEEARACRA